MPSRSPGRPWSVNRKISAARWTFTSDLTLTARRFDVVPESTVQVVQTNHCVQGCAMHNCRTREALDNLAVGRAALVPSCLGELPRVLQQRHHHVLFQQTQIFHIVPVLSVTSTFIQPQHEVSQIHVQCAWAAPSSCTEPLCQHMRHDRSLWNNAGDADEPREVFHPSRCHSNSLRRVVHARRKDIVELFKIDGRAARHCLVRCAFSASPRFLL